jgi:hypothetical protein
MDNVVPWADSNQPITLPTTTSRSKTEKEGLARKKKKAEKRAAGEDLKQKPMKPPFGGRVVVDLGFDEKLTDKVCAYSGRDLYSRGIGDQFALQPACGNIRGEPESWEALLAAVHFAHWKNTGTSVPGPSVQAVEKHGVVGRGLRTALEG